MEGGGSTYQENLPVKIVVAELLEGLGMEKDATKMLMAIGDCAIIVFYYLLQVGEYTVKKTKKQNKANGSIQVKRYHLFLSGN